MYGSVICSLSECKKINTRALTCGVKTRERLCLNSLMFLISLGGYSCLVPLISDLYLQAQEIMEQELVELSLHLE